MLVQDHSINPIAKEVITFMENVENLWRKGSSLILDTQEHRELFQVLDAVLCKNRQIRVNREGAV